MILAMAGCRRSMPHESKSSLAAGAPQRVTPCLSPSPLHAFGHLDATREAFKTMQLHSEAQWTVRLIACATCASWHAKTPEKSCEKVKRDAHTEALA